MGVKSSIGEMGSTPGCCGEDIVQWDESRWGLREKNTKRQKMKRVKTVRSAGEELQRNEDHNAVLLLRRGE